MNTSGQTPPAPKFQIRVNWKLALFSLVLLPVLVGLGVWQLQRAEEKKTIQESWQSQQALPPTPLREAVTGEAAAFRRVVAEGNFIPERYWLLENRILDGRLGYEVVMPLELTQGWPQNRVILVNRGWIPANAYRQKLPDVQTPEGEHRVTGSWITPSENRLIDEAKESGPWPRRILEVNPPVLVRQLDDTYEAVSQTHILRIDPESPGAFHTNWQPINMSPAKHRGYALQWFSMALALVILSIFANSNLAEVLFRRGSNGKS